MSSNIFLSMMMLLVLFSIFILRAESADFDITKLGAKPGADIQSVILDAWKQACGTIGASKVIIPKGVFNLGGPIAFEGPCKGTMEFQIIGTLKAPSEIKGDIWILFDHVDGLTVTGGGTFDGQGQAAWKKNTCKTDANCPNLRFHYCNKGTISGITSLNSKNFHINVLGCSDITFDHVTITAPADSPNTDGIHIAKSKDIKVRNTHIGTGDDCISIGDGSQQIEITDFFCGPGHGLSFGSLGKYENEEPVNGVHIKGATFDHSQNGIRIKSFAALESGMATDITVEDVTFIDVQTPINIDQAYCPNNLCKAGETKSKVKISNVSFKNVKGTTSSEFGVSMMCASNMPCDEIKLENVDIKTTNGAASKAECSNVKAQIAGTFTPAGTCGKT